MMKRVLLLTGKPGTGKTGLIKEVLSKTKIKAGGFFTEEIRHGKVRQGFRLITLDGKEAILAHVNISSCHQVGKYKVDTHVIDDVGVYAIRQALNESNLIVVDEIGKMELLSPHFSEALWQVIDSGKRLLGTIMLNPHPIADRIKSHPQVKILMVNITNRNEVLVEILNWLKETAPPQERN